MKNNTCSTVMTIANKLVGRGYRRRLAMLKAWIIVKAERLSVRVAGSSKEGFNLGARFSLAV